jgi:hypothetical protein
MRRVALTLLSAFLMLVAFPNPAAAWWEFLEELSGPGWWKGFDVDARLFCLVDTLPEKTEDDLVTRMESLVNRMKAKETRPRIEIAAQLPPELQRAAFVTSVRSQVDSWTLTLDEWERIFDDWQLVSGRTVEKIAAVRQALANIRMRADSSLAAVVPSAEAFFDSRDKRKELEAAVKKAEEDAAKAFEVLQRSAETMHSIVDSPRATFAALPGVIYSACRLRGQERRRAAFDVSMRFLWTNDDRYANGERISLTTIEPAFAWNVFDNPKYDIVEYGLGAGLYWISSKAFPSVKGGFLEPVRLDFHVPTDFVRSETMPRKIVRSLVFRFGYLVFPGGFEPDAFLADPLNPETNRRIGRDWVRYYGIYVDTEVFRKKM